MRPLKLRTPLRFERAPNEFLLVDKDGIRIAHFLFASDLLQAARRDEVEEIVHRANAYPKLVKHLDWMRYLFARQWCSGDEGARQKALDDAVSLLRELGEVK